MKLLVNEGFLKDTVVALGPEIANGEVVADTQQPMFGANPASHIASGGGGAIDPFSACVGLSLLGGALITGRRKRGLKRIGQLLRAVEDGNDVNAIWFDAIDQAIRMDDDLTQVFVIVFGRDAP